VSLTTVQACVLLGSNVITEGEAAAESVYYSVACRIAQLLDLPNRPTSNRIEREVNIRGMSAKWAYRLSGAFTQISVLVWWTLCLIDVWSSAGVRLPRQMVHQDNVPLPMDEATFLQMRNGNTAHLEMVSDPDPGSSLLAQMIKLNRILVEINEVNERAVAGRADGVILEDVVKDVSRKLDDWLAALPSYMRDTPANMARYAAQGLGSIFVTVYLGYYHFGQLLYYQFLHEDCHGSVPSAHFYANKCKAHAASLCEILYAANSTPGCEVLYTMVGHILVIASTVQVHILLFGADEDEIRTARSRLERNFEILLQLRTYWPTLEVSFTRFRAFHKACRNSMDTSFRMDQWMLRFLSEFANPVDDKYAEQADTSTWSVENMGISPEGTGFLQ
jgi:hypothetical protein